MAKWDVVCDDVLHWAESYSGPKFHAMLTDSPYELNFMSKPWDRRGISFNPATWAALAGHLLPGAHVLAFGGSRTHHRLMVAIEDVGLEIRDCIYWVQGAGFPKSLNVGKAIDKAVGAKREVVGEGAFASRRPRVDHEKQGLTFADDNYVRPAGHALTAPATPAAATWEGYGSALKPAVEVIVMARKPVEGTIAANCERYGSGALAIDACRVNLTDYDHDEYIPNRVGWKDGIEYGQKPGETSWFTSGDDKHQVIKPAGRWPANLILDDSEAVAGLFPVTTSGGHPGGAYNGSGFMSPRPSQNGKSRPKTEGDTGSAARFFFQATWELDQAEQLDAADVLRYAAKASRSERDAGLDSLPLRDVPYTDYRENTKETKSWVTEYPNGTPRPMSKLRNGHPTVKPLTLCRYLATLLLPPAAYAPRRILVPFAGVGSEMIGAGLAGWDEIVGIEQELEYTQIAEARLAYWLRQPELALR